MLKIVDDRDHGVAVNAEAFGKLALRLPVSAGQRQQNGVRARVGSDWRQPALEIADRQPSIELELIRRDRAERIRRAVEALPEKQRAAVLLHKYQEMDYDEIAGVLGCSESALKSLLFRAYETLRVELAPLVEAAQVQTQAGQPGK